MVNDVEKVGLGLVFHVLESTLLQILLNLNVLRGQLFLNILGKGEELKVLDVPVANLLYELSFLVVFEVDLGVKHLPKFEFGVLRDEELQIEQPEVLKLKQLVVLRDAL